MYLRGDFHLHTTASDGKLKVKELLNLIKEHNIDIISITDHDTLASLGEGIVEGEKLGIKVIPGIELSTRFNKEDVHILGYFRDDSYKTKEFKEFLKEMVDFRAYRAKKMAENLKIHFDINIDFKKLLESSKGVVGRPHIAKAIIEAGFNYSFDYIFENIIGENGPVYVPKKDLPLDEGIKLLKSVNALVVLAHPVLIKKNTIEELLTFDFDGIEAIYPLNNVTQTENFINLSKEYNKFITAGSDFHGMSDSDSKHGLVGSVTLDGLTLETFVNKLNIK